MDRDERIKAFMAGLELLQRQFGAVITVDVKGERVQRADGITFELKPFIQVALDSEWQPATPEGNKKDAPTPAD